MKRLIFVFVISAFHFPVMSVYLRHSRAAVSRCDDSLQGVREGFRCPSSQSEWEERAKEMKCETVTQNCTETNNFVYHCLINAWLNGTIEVCAPKIRIAGSYCTEFSKGGARVQAQYQSKCNSCPYIYNSSESYKYQECYELVKTSEMSTKTRISEISTKTQISKKVSLKNPGKTTDEENHNVTNDPRNEHGQALPEQSIIVICVIPFLLLLVCSVLVFALHRCQHGKHRLLDDNNKKNETNQLKINEDLVRYLCELENEESDSLKQKILESPYYKKHADIKLKPNQQQKIVTGNIQEDIGIQAAANVLNTKIFLQMQGDKETVVCFLPKIPDTERWIKIFVNEKNRYIHLSDWTKCNEESPLLTYDHVFGLSKKKKRKCFPWKKLRKWCNQI